jgi:hypothetical protein
MGAISQLPPTRLVMAYRGADLRPCGLFQALQCRQFGQEPPQLINFGSFRLPPNADALEMLPSLPPPLGVRFGPADQPEQNGYIGLVKRFHSQLSSQVQARSR